MRTRRVLLRVIVLLSLGAIVNVAVAWGSWTLLKRPLPAAGASGARKITDDEGAVLAARLSTDEPPPDKTHGYVGRNAWTTILCLYHMVLYERADGSSIPGVDTRLAAVYRCGWPCRTLEGIAYYDDGSANIVTRRVGLIRLHGRDRLYVHKPELPVRPMALGMIVNPLFFAIIIWCVIPPGPFIVRRWWRLRHGRCPGCAYPIGTRGVCTECARELPKGAAHPNDAPRSQL